MIIHTQDNKLLRRASRHSGSLDRSKLDELVYRVLGRLLKGDVCSSARCPSDSAMNTHTSDRAP